MAQRRLGTDGIRHAGAWLVFVRLVVGAWFLKVSIAKLAFVTVAGVLPVPTVSEQVLRAQPGRIAQFASQNPIPWYKDFLERRVIPHPKLFAFLVSFGELGVGIGVGFGLLTGFCALVGMFLTANYVLASGWMGSGSLGFPLLHLACLLAIFMSRAGRAWGLDAWLRRHFPNAWFARVPLLT